MRAEYFFILLSILAPVEPCDILDISWVDLGFPRIHALYMKGKVEALFSEIEHLSFINGAWLVDLRQVWVVPAHKMLKLHKRVKHHEQQDANTHEQAVDGRYRILTFQLKDGHLRSEQVKSHDFMRPR